MFSQNFKIFKYSRNIKENIFFSSKIISRALKNKNKTKWSTLFLSFSSKQQTLFITNYFKNNFNDKKRKKILFFSKRLPLIGQKTETVLSLLVKSRICSSHRKAANIVKQKQIILNNKTVFSPFVLVKSGDVLFIKNLPTITTNYLKSKFFSFNEKNKIKVLCAIPNYYEISFYGKFIIKVLIFF